MDQQRSIVVNYDSSAARWGCWPPCSEAVFSPLNVYSPVRPVGSPQTWSLWKVSPGLMLMLGKRLIRHLFQVNLERQVDWSVCWVPSWTWVFGLSPTTLIESWAHQGVSTIVHHELRRIIHHYRQPINHEQPSINDCEPAWCSQEWQPRMTAKNESTIS